MKLLFLIVIIATAVGGYTVEKVDEVDGWVWSLDFDIDSNTYLMVSKNDTYTFYKLNSTNNVVLTKELTGRSYFLLNSLGDVYIFEHNVNSIGLETVWYLEANTNSIKLLSQFYYDRYGCTDVTNFIDNDDIVYVNHKHGVSFLRPRVNILLAVDGLQEHSFCLHAVDGNGDLYLKLSNNQPAVITKVAKNRPILSAKTLDVPKGGIDFILNGYQNNVFGVNFDTDQSTHKVQMLKENSTELLFLSYDVTIGLVYFTYERFIFLSEKCSKSENLAWAYVLAPDGSIQKIESDFVFNRLIYNNVLPVTNSEGHIFYSWRNCSGDGCAEVGVLIIKPRELEIEKVAVPSEDLVYSMLVDVDENVWVVANGLYMLPKGGSDFIQISDLPLEALGENFYHMKEKPWNKEIYIGAMDGLYICKN